MLRVGDLAPDFEAPDQHGAVHSLRSLLDGTRLALYFYPKDFTPGCTKESCAFRDAGAWLAERGVRVVGVSADGQESHRRFAERHDLDFPLLSDEDLTIARAYGVLRPIFGLVKRVTFVIDCDRTVLGTFHHELAIAKHLSRVQALVQGSAPPTSR